MNDTLNPNELSDLQLDDLHQDGPGADPLSIDDALIAGEDPRIAALTAERDELRDRFMRALADAENARKRADKDRREAENYGGSRLARDLLPVYDALTRAIEAADPGVAPELLEGVQLTLRELQNVFSRHGIQVIAPAIGDRFDPQLHEAMFEAPVPGSKSGDIIQVMANGFMLHDRLLRAAQVGVSSMPAVN